MDWIMELWTGLQNWTTLDFFLALAAQARGVLGSTHSDCRLFLYFCLITSKFFYFQMLCTCDWLPSLFSVNISGRKACVGQSNAHSGPGSLSLLLKEHCDY